MSSGFFPATFEKALSASSFRQVRGTIRLHLTWFDCPKEGYKHLLAMMSWIFGIFMEVLSTPGFFCDGVSKPFVSMFQTFMCSKDSLDFSRCNPKTDQNWPKPQSLRVSFIRNFHPLSPLSPIPLQQISSDQISAPEWRLFPRSPPPVVSDLHSPWPTPTPMDSDGLKELLGCSDPSIWYLKKDPPILGKCGEMAKFFGVLLLISLIHGSFEFKLSCQISYVRPNGRTHSPIHAKNKVK